MRGSQVSLRLSFFFNSTGRHPADWPARPADTDDLEDLEGFRDLELVYRKVCQDNRSERYHSADEIHQQLLVLRAGRSVRSER